MTNAALPASCVSRVWPSDDAWIQFSSATHEKQAMLAKAPFHFAPQPNWRFNADAYTGHAFGIFLASVGTLRASRSGAG